MSDNSARQFAVRLSVRVPLQLAVDLRYLADREANRPSVTARRLLGEGLRREARAERNRQLKAGPAHG